MREAGCILPLQNTTLRYEMFTYENYKPGYLTNTCHLTRDLMDDNGSK